MDTLAKAQKQKRGELYLLQRALEMGSHGRFHASDEYAVWKSPDANPQKIVPTWEEMGEWGRRDLDATTASAGGFLADTNVPGLQSALLASSHILRGGAQIQVGLVGDQAVPTIDAMPTFEWLPANTTQLTSTDTLMLGSVPAEPHMGGVYLRVSYRLSKQANIEAQLRWILLQAAGLAIDYATLRGSGSNGEPRGLIVNSAVPTVAGASANASLLLTMEQALATANANDDRVMFLTDPATRTKLRQREASTGAGVLWPEKTIFGHAAFATSALPTNTIVAGDFSNLQVMLWGKGPEILIDPFSGFQSGRLDFGLFLAVDTIPVYGDAFYTATSVS